ncbi:Nitrilase [Kappamyces sp. JEL0680]|nr:Nitrilase [Kappamyces sp. JEL0680]
MAIRIAVASLCSTPNIKSNLEVCVGLMKKASSQGAQVCFFPEASDYISNSPEEALSLAQGIDGVFVEGIRQQAKTLGLLVSIGVHEKSSESSRLYNSHLLIDQQGSILEVYRKLHLFDVRLETLQLVESKHTIPGTRLVPPVPTAVGRIGLATCYDLRFPELSTLLQYHGMDILTYPSAFTIPTGEAHWHVLLRARAIETQAFVVAAAQHGQHTPKRSTYGHSLVVDPFGKVLVDAPNVQDVTVTDIDLAQLATVRQKMPVLEHRRWDVYSLALGTSKPNKF